MMDNSISFDFREMVRFQASLVRIGDKTVKKCVSRAAGRAATVVGKKIRSNAPVGKTKQLKKGFKRKKERTKVPNKAVYQYAMDSAKNDIFQKPIKNPGALGGKHKYWGYYPNSIEYGFLSRAKGGGIEYHRYGRKFSKYDNSWKKSANKIIVVGGDRHNYKAVEEVKGFQSKKIEGQHFVRNAATAAQPQVSKIVKRELFSELDKEWKNKK